MPLPGAESSIMLPRVITRLLSRTGARFTSVTWIENDFESLIGGVPLSVTVTVIG